VIKAKKYLKYFASQSAVPTFRNIVEILVDQNYLKPDLEKSEEIKSNEMIYHIEEEEPALPETPADMMETVESKPAQESGTPKKSITELFELKAKPKVNPAPKPVSKPTAKPMPKPAPRPAPRAAPKPAPKPTPPPKVNLHELDQQLF